MAVSLVLFEDDFSQIVGVCEQLNHDASARAVFLIEKDGQLIATAGESSAFDSTSLASLTAGNMAATDGLAKILGEREFGIQFHEGERDHIHISTIGERMILVVVFDSRSSLGLVRLRVKHASTVLVDIIEGAYQRSSTQSGGPISEITDAEIDRLLDDD